MNFRKMTRLMLVMLLVSLLAGCGGKKAPKSFMVSHQSHWRSIELREGLPYDRAWDTVLEILIKKFDLVTAIRQEGYIRTDWQHTWTGKHSNSYRVRVALKFNPERTVLQFRPEAQFLTEDENWVMGTDSRLIADLKADLMGTIGRTAR